jgi:DNA modification methylase
MRIVGDCRDVLPTLPKGSVQMCCTSPPYWGLRDYGVRRQIGLEKTPDCGRPFMKLRGDLTVPERARVLRTLQELGLI